MARPTPEVPLEAGRQPEGPKTTSVAATLAEAVERRNVGWLATARAQDFVLAFGSAARHLGKGSFGVSAAEQAALKGAGVDWPLDHLAVDEVGRMVLLLERARENASALEDTIAPCFFRGDNRERQAVLKALPLLPESSRWLPLAVEACRSNVRDVFEAIACDNPLPAWCFPDANLNQLVLKAIFVGLPVTRISGLAERVGPELLRMAEDYAAERRAAGRSVPDDIEILKRRARTPT